MNNNTTFNYTLEGNNPVPCHDLETWANWFCKIENRRVEVTDLKDFQVSTVFLGIDHSWYKDIPLLFETMVFKSDNLLNDYCRRYHTWDEAVAGHWAIVALIKLEVTEKSQ